MDKVIAAWTQEGANPPYHRWMQNKLRKEWPALARALDSAVQEKK